jgi:hypothetical protein
MCLRVVANLMTPRGGFAGKLRASAHMIANQEKSGAHLVLVEQIKQARRSSRIGAIVKG